jgi:hypothetical protein
MLTNANGFRAMKSLARAAADPRIAEIEGGGCDDGRVFLHLAPGYIFGGGENCSTRTVGSADELRYALRLIEVKKCKWFLRCTNPATTTVPHPILGDVPCCQGCADFARR